MFLRQFLILWMLPMTLELFKHKNQPTDKNTNSNKTPLERAIGKRHDSIATPKRNRKQSVEPAGK